MPGARPKASKAIIEDSPLQRPNKLIHQLASTVQSYLYMPDPSLFYVTLGAAAGNMIEGEPIWMIIVGGSSSGKTEMLGSLMELPKEVARVSTVSTIKSPAVLLSGVKKQDIKAGATGGLLKEVSPTGLLLMMDMAGMLQLPREPLGEILAAFRDIYNGHWFRPVGTDGGRVLRWGPGNKVGFLAASTSVIDRHHKISAELGERWIYYRMPMTDGLGEAQAALRNKNPAESRQAIREHVNNLFTGLELSMDQPKPKTAFRPDEEERFKSLASLAAVIRSGVPRDGYKNDVIDMVDTERPARLAVMLGQLYLGLAAIGLDEDECWPLIGKVAMDSVPRMRAEVVKALINLEWAEGSKTLAIRAVEELLGCSRGTVDIVLDDLRLLGVVRKILQSGGPGFVALTDWAKEKVKRGWDK